jgi:monoamine oxidase
LLHELDEMYGKKAGASFLSSHVINHTTHPHILGAYSYSTLGMGNARQTAAIPINEKIFFAGEAMNTSGNHQTVFGAPETGYRVVMNLIKCLSK